MKRLYVAATRRNEGKTTTCLGLMLALPGIIPRVGFIKPVGQRYVTLEDGSKVDEDAVLIHEVCHIYDHPKVMSPIAIERGFTRAHIANPDLPQLQKRIFEAFEKVSKDKDLMVIEGTGHAGVGSVFGLNNAAVAKMLKSQVIIVTRGGIGRPVDEVELNRAVFEKTGVEIIGVILNKVMEEKLDEVKKYVSEYLRKTGLELLGVIPFHPSLPGPTMGQIAEELKAEVLAGRARFANHIESIVVGATAPHEAIDYLRKGALVITPCSREDLILTVIGSHLIDLQRHQGPAGLLLTGDTLPHENVMRLVSQAKIPVLRVAEEIYEVASKVHDLNVKIRPADKKKIELAGHLVKHHVNVKRILERLKDS